MTGASLQEHPFWSRRADELQSALASGPQGLSAPAARERLERHGPNAVGQEGELSALRLLLRQWESPLVLILVFGAVVSLALRQWVDASIILAIVLGSTLLGFLQEYRASTAVAELKRRLALTCRVLRDGAEIVVPARAVVPGDVVMLSAGNLVPADGLVLEAKDCLVSESALTGETFPVEKQPGVLAAATPVGARTNAVFLGSSLRSGTARVLIVETGRRTEFGAIAARLGRRAPETEFARGIRQFGYLLLRVMILIVLFVLTVNQLLGRPVVDSLLFAVALAVGLSPELLPAVVSVTLSAGARAMARRGVIVRRLEAIENLGSMTVLCTDKTGTLTEGVVALHDAVDPAMKSSRAVRELAYLNASLESGIENPLDAAIVADGARSGWSAPDRRKIDEIPYDFRRKRLTIVVVSAAGDARHLIITKGAFANVLAICATVERPDGQAPLDAAAAGELEAYFRARSEEGYRVLAVATRLVPAKDRYGHDDEAAMSFAGFLLFYDPPKPDAPRIIRDLADLGVATKVISGDNRYVTAHLANAIGLDPRSLLTGAEIAVMKDEALWQQAARTDLFVEVDPQQKERIVLALRRTGHAVGYMGDGINDAPALHAADVGISVDSAVDVARQSADVILLQRDLDVLRQGVIDGRRTFANTLKYISITTSATFGNMISMALATPLLPFLPLAAKQILLNNFLSDLPSIAISTDNVDPEHVAHAQRWNIADVRRFMIVFGLVSSLFDLLTFGTLLLLFRADEPTFQTAWFVVSLLTELAVLQLLRTRGPVFASRPSRLLLTVTLVVGAVALAAPYAGPLSDAFGFVAISPSVMAASVAIVLGYMVATEATKALYFRRPDRRAGQ
ncbi:MAG: magnesium-translocating P-type ATPase [Alphaproteobacteria bacterium]|nr:magnesium-translocating P-type ATPase [Alphaproteobacteria bacterium]